MLRSPLLFLCSSPQDDPLLEPVLAQLGRLPVEIFSPRRLPPGAEVHQATAAALLRADLAVILLSAELLDRTTWDSQTGALFARKGLQVVPVLLRDCTFDLVPELAGLVTLPRNRRPLAHAAQLDESALRAVVHELRVLLPAQPTSNVASVPAEAGPALARATALSAGAPLDVQAPLRTAPFADTLRTTQGRLALVTALLAPAAAAVLYGLGWLQDPQWLVLLTVLASGASVGTFLRDVLRRRRLTFRAGGSVFVGARPLTESDRRRFFGREAEVREVLARLRDPQLRYLVLFGESGCGKSSLLRAGVLPELAHQGHFYGVYLRFFDQPVRELREALCSVSPPPDGPDPEGSPHNFAVSAQRTPNAAEKNARCWRRRPKASINGSNHSSRIVGMA